MFPFASDHDRRQHHEPAPGRAGHDRVDHLRNRLCGQGFGRVIRAMGRPDPRIQQAQVVMNFGDGADRGARIVTGRFLLNRNRGRQAFDQIDIGFFHQL